MKGSIIFAFAASILTAGMSTLTAQDVPRRGAALRIGRVEANTFRSDSGVLSGDILGDGRAGLLNTASGNSPWGPSRQLFVRVVVDGPARVPVSGSVRVRALVGTRAIGTSTVAVPWLEASGSTHAAFLFNHTGCSPIHLLVEVLSSSGAVTQTEERVIPFRCGE